MTFNRKSYLRPHRVYFCLWTKRRIAPTRRKARPTKLTAVPEAIQPPDSTPATASIVPSGHAQLNLFGLFGLTQLYIPDDRFTSKSAAATSARRKRKKSKKKRSHEKKGLQYKIRLQVRSTDRVIAYRTRDTEDRSQLNEETTAWSNAGINDLHRALLQASLCHAKRCDDLSLQSIAEVWLWMYRNAPDEPFSFVRCCEVSAVDPEVIRFQVKRLLGVTDKDTAPDYLLQVDLLRSSILAAEAGDADAIEWCLSDNTGPMTFVESCRAIGFDPPTARKELRVPYNMASQAA